VPKFYADKGKGLLVRGYSRETPTAFAEEIFRKPILFEYVYIAKSKQITK
jgi:hypothetical protein